MTSAEPLNGHARRRAATVERLVVAARELIEERGRHGLTVVAVAERAGVSEATVYKIFASRGELAAAALHGTMEPWADAVAATSVHEHPLRRLLAVQMALVSQEPEEKVLIWTLADQGPKSTEDLGLQTRTEDVLIKSSAVGLARGGTVSYEDALVWSSAYISAIRAVRLLSEGKQDAFGELESLKAYVERLATPFRPSGASA